MAGTAPQKTDTSLIPVVTNGHFCPARDSRQNGLDRIDNLFFNLNFKRSI